MTGRIDQPDVDSVDQRSAKSRHALSNSDGARKGKMDRAILFRGPHFAFVSNIDRMQVFFFDESEMVGKRGERMTGESRPNALPQCFPCLFCDVFLSLV